MDGGMDGCPTMNLADLVGQTKKTKKKPLLERPSTVHVVVLSDERYAAVTMNADN